MNFNLIKESIQKSRCGLCEERMQGCKNLDFNGKCNHFKLMRCPAINWEIKDQCKICSNFFTCIVRQYPYEQCPGGEKYIPRCGKCVYDSYNCGDTDFHGECKTYRRDPPDGGYYG